MTTFYVDGDEETLQTLLCFTDATHWDAAMLAEAAAEQIYMAGTLDGWPHDITLLEGADVIGTFCVDLDLSFRAESVDE